MRLHIRIQWECGNRLRVGVRAENASVSGLRVGPSKGQNRGVEAIVCDNLKNRVWQGHRYTYLSIGGFNLAWPTKTGTYPPAQNQYMHDKMSGELVLVQINAGPVFALARIQESTFEELCFKCFGCFFGEFISVQIHATPVLHLREYRKNILANYVCIGFVPGCKLAMPALQRPNWNKRTMKKIKNQP